LKHAPDLRSAAHSIAVISSPTRHSHFVPIGDLSRCSKLQPYSTISSARASRLGGTSRLSAFAVVKLMARSNLVGCSTGIFSRVRFERRNAGSHLVKHRELTVFLGQ
jgi:hypothetical protein